MWCPISLHWIKHLRASRTPQGDECCSISLIPSHCIRKITSNRALSHRTHRKMWCTRKICKFHALKDFNLQLIYLPILSKWQRSLFFLLALLLKRYSLFIAFASESERVFSTKSMHINRSKRLWRMPLTNGCARLCAAPLGGRGERSQSQFKTQFASEN